mmetsp:Transcript_3082/g.10064  ORF Transcript_3082/g.10064 Transcript_3082/m.10064 type:complete len:339 (-) Transcript_3082:693-1709(-)
MGTVFGSSSCISGDAEAASPAALSKHGTALTATMLFAASRHCCCARRSCTARPYAVRINSAASSMTTCKLPQPSAAAATSSALPKKSQCRMRTTLVMPPLRRSVAETAAAMRLRCDSSLESRARSPSTHTHTSMRRKGSAKSASDVGGASTSTTGGSPSALTPAARRPRHHSNITFVLPAPHGATRSLVALPLSAAPSAATALIWCPIRLPSGSRRSAPQPARAAGAARRRSSRERSVRSTGASGVLGRAAAKSANSGHRLDPACVAPSATVTLTRASRSGAQGGTAMPTGGSAAAARMADAMAEQNSGCTALAPPQAKAVAKAEACWSRVTSQPGGA